MTLPNAEQLPAYPYAAPIAPPKSPILGRSALILAIAVFVLSAIASVFVGITAGSTMDLSEANDFSSGFDAGYNSTQGNPAAAALGLGILLHVSLGTLAGIAALVLGIVAAVSKRGRVEGVVAIVLGALAPGVSFVVYVIALTAVATPAG